MENTDQETQAPHRAVSLTDKSKSRKFIFSVGIVFINAFLVYAGKIDGAIYSSILNVVITGYIFGNVTSAFVDKKVS